MKLKISLIPLLIYKALKLLTLPLLRDICLIPLLIYKALKHGAHGDLEQPV